MKLNLILTLFLSVLGMNVSAQTNKTIGNRAAGGDLILGTATGGVGITLDGTTSAATIDKNLNVENNLTIGTDTGGNRDLTINGGTVDGRLNFTNDTANADYIIRNSKGLGVMLFDGGSATNQSWVFRNSAFATKFTLDADLGTFAVGDGTNPNEAKIFAITGGTSSTDEIAEFRTGSNAIAMSVRGDGTTSNVSLREANFNHTAGEGYVGGTTQQINIGSGGGCATPRTFVFPSTGDAGMFIGVNANSGSTIIGMFSTALANGVTIIYDGGGYQTGTSVGTNLGLVFAGNTMTANRVTSCNTYSFTFFGMPR